VADTRRAQSYVWAHRDFARQSQSRSPYGSEPTAHTRLTPTPSRSSLRGCTSDRAPPLSPSLARANRAYLNDDAVTIELCLKIDDDLDPATPTPYPVEVGIRKVTEEKLGFYPDNDATTLFDYPLDELNFPASGVLAPEEGTITGTHAPPTLNHSHSDAVWSASAS
jgi:hypothetical protein